LIYLIQYITMTSHIVVVSTCCRVEAPDLAGKQARQDESHLAPCSDEVDGTDEVPYEMVEDASSDESIEHPGWLHSLCETEFFEPCAMHPNLSKNKCVFFCVGCSPGGRVMCRHCLEDHDCHGCTLFQIRRYMYKDVVHVADISKFCDVSGVQAYCINQKRAVLLRGKTVEQGSGAPTFKTKCATCRIPLRSDCTYCSLECRIEDCISPRTPKASKYRKHVCCSSSSDDSSDDSGSTHQVSLRNKRERQVQSRYRPYARRRKAAFPSRSPFL